MTQSSSLRRDRVMDLLANAKRPLHTQQIATALDLEPREYTALQRILDDLVFDGSIAPSAGQRFHLTKKAKEARITPEIEGTLTVNPRGFGFVTSPGAAEDLFIPAESMAGAMHGDTVRARVAGRSKLGLGGEILAIVRRRNTRVAGVLRKRGKSAWIEPDDTRMRGPIVIKGAAEGNDGDAAVVEIDRFPALPDENPEGHLLAVLGSPGDPLVEGAKLLLREGVEESHPEAAIAEAAAFGDRVQDDALVGREDLTHLPLPTIDPEDARDHDDAVWVKRDEDGNYTAWIAIADVSHYVAPGTALDAAALARGTSIYLPDRAIPMLPSALSSKLCSLLPHEIRLCLAVQITLDPAGEPLKTRVFEGFMRSAAKLTYPGVARALRLTEATAQQPEAEAMAADLAVMMDLSMLLRARRLRRGALMLDVPEPKVVLDAEKRPIDVVRRSQDPGVAKAYQLIEEMMLLANERVAQFFLDRDAPTVFRNHGTPDETKLARFAAACETLGIPFDVEEAMDPKKLAKLVKKLDKHPRGSVLHTLLLRSLRQAAYEAQNIGHFGLASPAYLHFTSPIRRYPDLVVHRATRALLRGEPVDRSPAALEALRIAAQRSSENERRAMEIEREVVDIYRAAVMKQHLGEIATGTVSAFVSTGAFVTLDKPFADVLVRTEALGPGAYEADELGLAMTEAHTGDRIELGDSIAVVIEDVSVERRLVQGRRLPRTVREDGDGPAPKKRKTKRTKATTPVTTKAERAPAKKKKARS